MDEYITKRKAIESADQIIQIDDSGDNTVVEAMKAWKVFIEAIPAADVVPVVHARWVNYSPVTIKCSRCGHVIHDWRYSECKYCPNCGAKMDGERKE